MLSRGLASTAAPMPSNAPPASASRRSRRSSTWTLSAARTRRRIVAAYPGKFVGFGTIGFGNPQRAVAEVDRCITQLGFKGLQIFSNIAGKMPDSAEHRAVFQHIGRIARKVTVDPQRPVVGFRPAEEGTERCLLTGEASDHTKKW